MKKASVQRTGHCYVLSKSFEDAQIAGSGAMPSKDNVIYQRNNGEIILNSISRFPSVPFMFSLLLYILEFYIFPSFLGNIELFGRTVH